MLWQEEETKAREERTGNAKDEKEADTENENAFSGNFSYSALYSLPGGRWFTRLITARCVESVWSEQFLLADGCERPLCLRNERFGVAHKLLEIGCKYFRQCVFITGTDCKFGASARTSASSADARSAVRRRTSRCRPDWRSSRERHRK